MEPLFMQIVAALGKPACFWCWNSHAIAILISKAHLLLVRWDYQPLQQAVLKLGSFYIRHGSSSKSVARALAIVRQQFPDLEDKMVLQVCSSAVLYFMMENLWVKLACGRKKLDILRSWLDRENWLIDPEVMKRLGISRV